MIEELPLIQFLTNERASDLWQFIYALLYVVMPLLLIWLAIQYSGYLISVLRDAFTYDRMKKDSDYEEYDDEDK